MIWLALDAMESQELAARVEVWDAVAGDSSKGTTTTSGDLLCHPGPWELLQNVIPHDCLCSF